MTPSHRSPRPPSGEIGAPEPDPPADGSPVDGAREGGATSSRNPRKRTRTADASYAPRTRAAAACQFCRLRKTKCDNARPVCGFCRYHRARCVYTDSAEEQQPHQPGLDEATIQYNTLLGRLDEIRDIVKGVGRGPDLSTRPSYLAPNTPLSATPNYPSTTKCEAIIRWPIFKGVIQDSDTQVDSFILEDPDNTPDAGHSVGKSAISPATVSTTGSAGQHTLAGRGISEEAFVPLCRKFLDHVHARNPILEAQELLAYAKGAAENGLAWDAPSCLVLLACALACGTQPWEAPDTPGVDQQPEANQHAGDIYYLAAKKRIGLLEGSLLDIQCLFFACVYEKFSFRPLQAWFYLQQAGTRLRVRCQSRSATGSGSGEQVPWAEQRLFWTLFKADSELLPELGLTPSCLRELDYPDPFPEPPASLLAFSRARDGGGDLASIETVGHEQKAEEERSWFFYLAEISLRRIINDTLHTFYDKGEEHWMRHIDLVCRQHHESEEQVSQWLSHLPSSIRFDPYEQPDSELVYYLQGRLEEWREYILRPLLYYYLHHRPSETLSEHIISLARQEIATCAASIRRCAQHGRHGGTWLIARRSFRGAVLILGVVLRDGPVEAPGDWRELVGVTLATLGRWEGSSPDLRRLRVVLEKLLREVYSRRMSEPFYRG